MNQKTKATALLIAACIYLLMPADVCPDLLPGIGNADDMVVMLLGTKNYFGGQK